MAEDEEEDDYDGCKDKVAGDLPELEVPSSKRPRKKEAATGDIDKGKEKDPNKTKMGAHAEPAPGIEIWRQKQWKQRKEHAIQNCILKVNQMIEAFVTGGVKHSPSQVASLLAAVNAFVAGEWNILMTDLNVLQKEGKKVRDRRMVEMRSNLTYVANKLRAVWFVTESIRADKVKN